MTKMLLAAAAYVVIVFPNAGGFIVMETAYLVVQFGLFALTLSFIYRRVE